MEQPWDDKPVRPDAQGQFEIGGLPVDLSYRVYASAPGFGRSKREVTFPEAHGPRVSSMRRSQCRVVTIAGAYAPARQTCARVGRVARNGERSSVRAGASERE